MEENITAEDANQTDITNPNNTGGSDKTNVVSPPAVDVAMPTSNLMATYLEYWYEIYKTESSSFAAKINWS